MDSSMWLTERTIACKSSRKTERLFVKHSYAETLGSGSVSGVTLSVDTEERWVFIPDGTNNVVWILDRESLTIAGHFGRLGKYAGQFYRLHNLAIDSRRNLYSTEVNVGQRVQKFARIRASEALP